MVDILRGIVFNCDRDRIPQASVITLKSFAGVAFRGEVRDRIAPG